MLVSRIDGYPGCFHGTSSQWLLHFSDNWLDVSRHSLSIEAAGFRMLKVNDPAYPALNVGLWYPSDRAEAGRPDTPFEMSVALVRNGV